MRPKPTWHPYINRDDRLAEELFGAWYALEGAGALAHDLSGTGNHGTLRNSATWTAAQNGPALDLRQSDAGVVVPGTDSLSVDHITIFARFQFTTAPAVKYLMRRDSPYHQIYQKFSGVLTLDLETVNGRDLVDSGTAFSAGQWYTYAGTYDGTTMRVYTDGAPDGSKVHSGGGVLAPTLADLTIGNRPILDQSLKADVDVFLFYARALPASSIRRLHHDPTRLLRPVRRWWAVVDVAEPRPDFVPQTYTADVLVNPSPTVSAAANPSPTTDLESNPSPKVEVESG